MTTPIHRRHFLKTAATAAAGLGIAVIPGCSTVSAQEQPFKISLAEWSLNRPLFDGEIDNLDFAILASEHGIKGVEYVNQFFMDKANDQAYLREMKTRAEGEGVQSVLIMCDGEGQLGDPNEQQRMQAVENHYKWVEAAKYLGCHSIRVNARSEGSFEEQLALCADGFRHLVEFAAERDMNVILENHGGPSSNAEWVVKLMEAVDHPRCGTLPDFGNFRIDEDDTYSSYRGVKQMMPYAKGVSVKPMGYDAEGNHVKIDLLRMMTIVTEAGYHNWCGIEHGGPEGREWEGIMEVKRGLIRAREELA